MTCAYQTCVWTSSHTIPLPPTPDLNPIPLKQNAGYKFSECSRFAQAFDLSSPMWEAFYASGQQGRLRAEIIQVLTYLLTAEEETD